MTLAWYKDLANIVDFGWLWYYLREFYGWFTEADYCFILSTQWLGDIVEI